MYRGRVSYEQITFARTVNFIDFLEMQYPDKIAYDPTSRVYYNPEHDSMKYNESSFFWFSRDKGGDSIRFLTDYIGLTFQEAVIQLCKFDGLVTSEVQVKAIKRENKTYEKPEKPLPFKAKSDNELITYLINKRGIDRATVDMLIGQDVLYQDNKQNLVFANRKQNFAIIRGTRDDWKNILNSGIKYWCFEVGQDNNDVYITEAPIDSISLYILKDKAPGIYCAMGGLKSNILGKIIEDFKDKKNIFLAPDWDSKGAKFGKEEAEHYKIKWLHPSKERIEKNSNCKDWNELLLFEKK